MKFRNNTRRRARTKPDLTPLIDVVFQLLIFFMLSSTFVVQSSIHIQMPEAEGAVAFEKKDLSVTLQYGEDGPGGGGRIFVDNEEVASLDELTQVLSAFRKEHPQVTLLIRPDARVETGRLIRVMGIASSVGIEDYQVAAQPTS